MKPMRVVKTKIYDEKKKNSQTFRVCISNERKKNYSTTTTTLKPEIFRIAKPFVIIVIMKKTNKKKNFTTFGHL